MSRRPLVAGNWKMHTGRDSAVALAAAVAAGAPSHAEIAVFPPFPWLIPVAQTLAGSVVRLGAQDCWTEPAGAVTGAVSPTMLAEICSLVIVGHSERRKLFGESDDLVATKTRAAQAAGLTPIVCVGEDLAVRQTGQAIEVVSNQVERSLAGVAPADIARLVIAYEPVWAIGTGVAATSTDAHEMAHAIRTVIRRMAGDAARSVRILYGGSVTPANAAGFMDGAEVDGALVGGASLTADSFLAIAAAVAH